MRLAGAAAKGQGMPAPRPGARQGGPRCGGGEEEEEEEEDKGRVHNGGVRQYRRDSKQASARRSLSNARLTCTHPSSVRLRAIAETRVSGCCP
jgi:hypothetical protein